MSLAILHCYCWWTKFCGSWCEKNNFWNHSKSQSGQIIATSHDLTPNGGLVRELPLFQENLGWWNIIFWPAQWLVHQTQVHILGFHMSSQSHWPPIFLAFWSSPFRQIKFWALRQNSQIFFILQFCSMSSVLQPIEYSIEYYSVLQPIKLLFSI